MLCSVNASCSHAVEYLCGKIAAREYTLHVTSRSLLTPLRYGSLIVRCLKSRFVVDKDCYNFKIMLTLLLLRDNDTENKIPVSYNDSWNPMILFSLSLVGTLDFFVLAF